jgi:phosphatidyl-myo-inositol dimannoside synthase
VSKPSQRILFATAGLDIGGGIESVARSTLSALTNAVQSGDLGNVDVLVFHGSAPTNPLIGASEVSDSRKYLFSLRFARLARPSRCDLVVFDSLGVARSILLIPPALRPPHLVFAHGQELDPPVRKALVSPMTSAREILTVSQTSAAKIRQIPTPAPLPPIRVISPCVSRDRIALWSDLDPPAATLPPTILSVGRMVSGDPGKGHDTLIAAMPMVVEAIPSARLKLVGDGTGRPVLEALANSLGLGACVEFTGAISDHDLGKAYRSANVFAMPSRQEGFGIVYAEAMWFGLPCIGSTADAAGDVIDDRSSGLLVQYGDERAVAEAIIRLLGDPSQAAAMGAAGRRKCHREFSPSAFESRVMDAVGGAPD